MSHHIDRAVGQVPARGPRYEEPSDGDQDLLLDEATKNSRRREVCVVGGTVQTLDRSTDNFADCRDVVPREQLGI